LAVESDLVQSALRKRGLAATQVDWLAKELETSLRKQGYLDRIGRYGRIDRSGDIEHGLGNSRASPPTGGLRFNVTLSFFWARSQG